MKQIQAIQIWVNGQVQTGNYINAYIIHDNLQDSASFYWAIFTSDTSGIQLAQGNLTIVEPDYSVWDSTVDINESAYLWICDQLGLTLIELQTI
jgi:hypothetical protein